MYEYRSDVYGECQMANLIELNFLMNCSAPSIGVFPSITRIVKEPGPQRCSFPSHTAQQRQQLSPEGLNQAVTAIWEE